LFLEGFAEALETKEENFYSLGEKENANSSIAAILNVTRAFSAPILLFLRCFCGTKKREKGIFCFPAFSPMVVFSVFAAQVRRPRLLRL